MAGAWDAYVSLEALDPAGSPPRTMCVLQRALTAAPLSEAQWEAASETVFEVIWNGLEPKQSL